MKGSQWEADVVFAFDHHIKKNNIKAVAHRLEKASRFSPQFCDVVVDSLDRRYYLAIEAKSMLLKKQKYLYFSRHFSLTPVSQLDRMAQFCDDSGRTGYLAVEFRGHPRTAFLVPFDIVYNLYKSEEVGVPVELILKGTPFRRDDGHWFLDKFI